MLGLSEGSEGEAAGASKPAASPAWTVDDEFISYLHKVEGGEQHRRGGRWYPYNTDGAGKWTIGRGHLINGGESPKGFEDGLSDEEVEQLFKEDVIEAATNARNAVGPDVFDALPQKDRQLFTDFSFNLGPEWSKKFPKMADAVLRGDRETALAESKRFKTDPAGNTSPLKDRNDQTSRFFFGVEPTEGEPLP